MLFWQTFAPSRHLVPCGEATLPAIGSHGYDNAETKQARLDRWRP